MIKCTYIDGIASSQAIDTAGEIVELKGLDITSLVGAAYNFEHESKLPSQIVGKILEATKIYKKEDCTNDRHLFYWNKCQTPFLYVMGRLFDDKKPSAVEVAALFKDDAEHPGESDMVGFSVEGSKIEKVGVVITRSIARKVTITHIPANKTCIAEIMPAKPESKDDDLSSLFKGEMELFQFAPTYVEIMEKKEDLMKRNPIAAGVHDQGGGIGRGAAGKGMKAVGSSAGALGGATGGAVGSMKQGGGSFIGQRRDRKNPFFLSEDTKDDMDKKEKLKKDSGMGIGATPDMGGGSGGNAGGGAFVGSQLAMSEDWKSDAAGHSMNHPSGHKFKVRTDSGGSGHSLEHTNPKGEVTIHRPFQSPQHAKGFASGLIGDSNMNKSLTAGSGMAAPSQLTGGAALARENLEGKPKRIPTPAQKVNDSKMHKKEKTKWFDRADEAYKTWDKREDFRGYMKKRMPHLAEGEVDAIGRVLALKKTVQAEGKLSKMYASYFNKKSKE